MPPPVQPHAWRDDQGTIHVETDLLAAEVAVTGYVTGIRGGTLLDRRSGTRDHSFGLDVVDFLMEPGAEGGLPYEFGNLVHGNIAKHYVELPQICTQAGRIDTDYVVGRDFVAVRQWWQWTQAGPGLRPGSRWEQTIVFPAGRRYVLASDQVTSANDYREVFLRIDLPGHIKHRGGDTFEEVYLSYAGRIPASDFAADFPPDSRHLYQRGQGPVPLRMIRAQKYRGPAAPWLAGMTLDPAMVYEAWCHQRGYVCFIEEIGGVAMKAGDRFSAAHIIGYFDSIGQMEAEYDRYRGMNSIAATADFWMMSDGVLVRGRREGEYCIVAQGRRPAPKSWRVLVHGRGSVVVNGQVLAFQGERTALVPADS